MKKSAGLYLSAREASAELAISQATLYAYVSRGLIRSEPSADSRSHRYRAEDVRTLKERRTPAPEPRGMPSFAADPRAYTRAPEGRAMVGGRIMRLVVATMLNARTSPQPLHLQIARAWAPDNKHAADLIRRALVLLADHELNASTFTVRCAASTGLNLYDAIIAGLVALKGPRHGGAGVLAAQLVKTLVNGDVAPIIRERVALGDRFAGFGHGVYKHGDPRARTLLEPLPRTGA